MNTIAERTEGQMGLEPGAGRAPEAPARPAPALPCLLSEQLNWSRGGRTQKRQRQAVQLEIAGMAQRWGFVRLGFLTGTFPDNVQTIREAQRRFNSMNTNAMRGRFEEWLTVVQRHKDGRVHLHLVVACKEDIRTGFDFEAVRRRDYSSASPYLRAEWKFWRDYAPHFGFGRMELLPMRTSVERFAGYVARYVTRDGGVTRRNEKGARLVRYSKGFKRVVRGRFSWLDDREKIKNVVLRQEKAFEVLRIRGETDAEFRWGRGWRRHFNRLFYSHPITFISVLGEVACSLECYDGVTLAIAEAFDKLDLASRR